MLSMLSPELSIFAPNSQAFHLPTSQMPSETYI
jgi:hypothetical protein